MAVCLVGLGSNLGDRAGFLNQAIAALGVHPEIQNLSVSSFHTTKPIGGPGGQSEFLNAAARFETTLTPQVLLDELHRIESELGRTRDIRWSERTIDLDLLLYDTEIIETNSLIVPHPHMAFRRFVLEPAAEIAGEMIHAPTGSSVKELWVQLRLFPNYVAITGGAYAEREKAARQAAQQVGGRYLADPAGAEFESYVRGRLSPARGRQHEILDRRKVTIRDVTESAPAEFAISDFWLGESFALAEALQPTIETAQIKLRAYASDAIYLPPKLLVLIGNRFPRARLTEPDCIAFERSLLKRATFAGCPLLTLQTTAPELVAEEVAAAVLAMQARSRLRLAVKRICSTRL